MDTESIRFALYIAVAGLLGLVALAGLLHDRRRASVPLRDGRAHARATERHRFFRDVGDSSNS